ncbi:hypothetical protein NDU88_008806 [Pleurodeles waltl]|uniref:Uncharacterized protein n=1 Tax=Pleurodeles waltl TaxID=8319 RepID=A0AAV7NYU8_PLEWA|nr:hypothetical protein NDU88_008806 [Pleurodeles waltl]
MEESVCTARHTYGKRRARGQYEHGGKLRRADRVQPQQVQSLEDVMEMEMEGSSPSCRGPLDDLVNGGLNSEAQSPEMDKVLRMGGDIRDIQRQAQSPRAKSPMFEIPFRLSPRRENGHRWGLSEETPNQSIVRMLRALSLEVRGGFETSNINQKEIRGLCETLGKKIDDLAGRTAALEEEVGNLKTMMETNKAEIQKCKE